MSIHFWILIGIFRTGILFLYSVLSTVSLTVLQRNHKSDYWLNLVFFFTLELEVSYTSLRWNENRFPNINSAREYLYCIFAHVDVLMHHIFTVKRDHIETIIIKFYVFTYVYYLDKNTVFTRCRFKKNSSRIFNGMLSIKKGELVLNCIYFVIYIFIVP